MNTEKFYHCLIKGIVPLCVGIIALCKNKFDSAWEFLIWFMFSYGIVSIVFDALDILKLCSNDDSETESDDIIEENDIDPEGEYYFYGMYSCGRCVVCCVESYLDNGEMKAKESFSFIDERGEYITNEWFLKCTEFENDTSIVVQKSNGKYNILLKDGSKIFQNGYDNINLCSDGIFKVKIDNRVNYYSLEKGFMWDLWKDEYEVGVDENGINIIV